MALKSYVLTQTVKSPVVIMTHRPSNPQQVKFKIFRKGEIVNGELKHANNKPAFILAHGVCVIPLSAVKEVITKEISNGETASAEGKADDNKSIEMKSKISIPTNPKTKYLDGIVLGGIAGFGLMYLAEKKAWIQVTDKNSKWYATAAGAVLGLYIVYRFKK